MVEKGRRDGRGKGDEEEGETVKKENDGEMLLNRGGRDRREKRR